MDRAGGPRPLLACPGSRRRIAGPASAVGQARCCRPDPRAWHGGPRLSSTWRGHASARDWLGNLDRSECRLIRSVAMQGVLAMLNVIREQISPVTQQAKQLPYDVIAF